MSYHQVVPAGSTPSYWPENGLTVDPSGAAWAALRTAAIPAAAKSPVTNCRFLMTCSSLAGRVPPTRAAPRSPARTPVRGRTEREFGEAPGASGCRGGVPLAWLLQDRRVQREGFAPDRLLLALDVRRF